MKNALTANAWRPECQLRASLVQLRGPVENDGHGSGFALPDRCVDQKALTIAAHVVDELVIGRDHAIFTLTSSV